MLSFNNYTTLWAENGLQYKILWHFETVKWLIVCWYFSVKKVKSMAMLYGRKWRFKCYPFGYEENYALQNCSKCWLPLVSQNKNMVHSCTYGIQFNSKTWQEKYLAFFYMFCFGQNSDFIRTISPWSLQIFKISILPLQFFNRMQYTNNF